MIQLHVPVSMTSAPLPLPSVPGAGPGAPPSAAAAAPASFAASAGFGCPDEIRTRTRQQQEAFIQTPEREGARVGIPFTRVVRACSKAELSQHLVLSRTRARSTDE